MKDVTQQPFGATCGIMGWPYPGHSWTLWRHYVYTEGLAPHLLALDGHVQATNEAWEALYADVRTVVMEQLRESSPVLARWAESVDWLQVRGRGDVVAVMSRHTGAILSHHCLGWREDYRDSSGVLWNWEWVAVMPDPVKPGRMTLLRADASGCVLDKRGEPSSKVLVRPAICGEEAAGILARWQSAMGEALQDMPPVRTVLVEHEAVDWEAYERDMTAALNGALEVPWQED